jgi:predicted NACHT family NTPase/DNA-binding Xre family transcriptional regulator
MATPRSLKLSPDGKRQVNRALTDKAWRDADLAEAIGASEQTAEKFRLERKVDRKNFVKFCQALGLDWVTVAEPESPPAPNSGGAEPVEKARSTTAESLQQNSNKAQGIQVQGSETTIVGQTVNIYKGSETQSSGKAANTKFGEIDEEKIRQHCREKILQNYSKIRLLSGQEIGVDQLYVDVWLLDRQPRTFQISQDKMLRTFDLRQDRLGLGDRIKRNDGFNVANQASKLLILGKPGAGKTTFLKHLAIDWCRGKFQSNLIAVFIEFRQISDAQWKALDNLIKKFGKKSRDLKERKGEWLELIISDKLDAQEKDQTTALLKQGKLLVMMDGFDEVPTEEIRKHVGNQIKELTDLHPRNRFIITCRTQIIESIPIGFSSVEVADFNPNQVEKFVRNWFWANTQNVATVDSRWNAFEESTQKNIALRELTETPVLLGLMCLVFQDEGEIPAQASYLYERGIKLLLKKWNDAKVINGWEMGTEAYRQLSIEQKENLLIQIAAKKFNSPDNFVLFKEDELIAEISDRLELSTISEGKAILKAIEAQHGLLIERADELWSFSHLTFQEHFTTKWLSRLTPEELSKKIANKRWQEVVQQLIKSQGQSDRLLRLIKRAIDYSVSADRELQEFLMWVQVRAESMSDRCQLCAKRALYLTLTLNLGLNLALNLKLSRARARDHTIEGDLALSRVLSRVREFSRARSLPRSRERILDRDLSRARDLIPDLTDELEQLRMELTQGVNEGDFSIWWNENGLTWREKLQKLMTRRIGHNCQFTNEQEHKLKSYHDVNAFLLELLKIENSASPEARQEIEDNLLLPIAELKRRLPDQYGGIEES